MLRPALAILALLLLAGCSGSDGRSCADGEAEHQDAEAGYAFCVPKGWTRAEFGAAAAFMAPGSADDGFAENVNVVHEDAQGADLEAYRERNLELLRQYISDFRLVASRPAQLGGGDAASLEYTGSQGQFDLRWYQVLAVHDGRAYVATYTAQDGAAYQEHLGAAKESFESFRFL